MNTLTSARRFAVSDEEARQYLPTRRADSEALVAQGLTNLDYVAVRALPGGQVLVGGVVCASPLAAVAYILAKFW